MVARLMHIHELAGLFHLFMFHELLVVVLSRTE